MMKMNRRQGMFEFRFLLEILFIKLKGIQISWNGLQIAYKYLEVSLKELALNKESD